MLFLFCPVCSKIVETEPVEYQKDGCVGICPHCNTRLFPHRHIEPGTVINGFRIKHEIGRGGMGVVYLATQINLERDVAFKILSDEMASDPAFIEAFFREARAAAALNHPNIVQAYDAGSAENRIYYFVMELIEGENLEVHTERNGALDIKLAFKCATSIADALTYAWNTKRLAHRDIKPENIIFNKNSEFKLADLGLAKAYNEGTSESEDDTMATPAYASPEVIRGERDKIGYRSDMYSFGATLYQLFTGKPPFEGSDPMEICDKQLNEQPKPLIGVNPRLPSRLSMLVDKLMEKAQKKRPETWDDVLTELNGIATSYYQELAHKKAQREAAVEKAIAARKRMLLIIISAMSVLLLAGLTFFLIPDDGPEKKVKTVETVTTTEPADVDDPAEKPAETPPVSAPEQQQPAATTASTDVITTPPQATIIPGKRSEDLWLELKMFLPHDPYARWNRIRQYISNHSSAPESARNEFAKLDAAERIPWIDAFKKELSTVEGIIKSINRGDGSALINTLTRLEYFFNTAKSYPLWAASVLQNDKLAQLKDEQEKLNAALKDVRMRIRGQQILAARKKNVIQELEGMIRTAPYDIFKRKIDEARTTFSAVPQTLQTLDKMENLVKYRDVPLQKTILALAPVLKSTQPFPHEFQYCTLQKCSDKGMIFLQRQGMLKMPRRVSWTEADKKKTAILADLVMNLQVPAKADDDAIMAAYCHMAFSAKNENSLKALTDAIRKNLRNKPELANRITDLVEVLK